MKTQKRNRRDSYLQASNNRWKWMAGATAATAAGVSASQASTITINLIDNYISGSGGDHLNADLTGDGHPDLTIAGAKYFYSFHHTTTGHYNSGPTSSAAVVLNGVLARGFHTEYPQQYARLGSEISDRTGPYVVSVMGSIPIFFKDLHINGGAPTKASLQVTVSGGGAKIQLDTLTYNTPGQGSRLAAAVPDQSSSLALLAMGAGGIVALRRWIAARERS
jgi:hypothetical protein